MDIRSLKNEEHMTPLPRDVVHFVSKNDFKQGLSDCHRDPRGNQTCRLFPLLLMGHHNEMVRLIKRTPYTLQDIKKSTLN